MRNPRWLKPAAHALLALPMLLLAARWALLLSGDATAAGLGAEPVAATINALGIWALRILLLALAVTPLRTLTGWTPIMSLRRAIGLWAFAYACMHMALFLGLDLAWSLTALWQEVVKRRYILFGMAALIALLPLAITSTSGWVKRLGARRWRNLHRLAYAAGLLASIHFLLRVKGFQIEPWIYASIFAALMLLRLRFITSRVSLRGWPNRPARRSESR